MIDEQLKEFEIKFDNPANKKHGVKVCRYYANGFASMACYAIFTTPKSTVKSILKNRNVQMYTVETDIEKAENSTTVN